MRVVVILLPLLLHSQAFAIRGGEGSNSESAVEIIADYFRIEHPPNDRLGELRSRRLGTLLLATIA
jgi:hypothetical protein